MFRLSARADGQGEGGGSDPHRALEQVTAALLTSPQFLYRVELGAPDSSGRFRYAGWELASRMSYFLWNSTPDDELLDAAAAGALDTPDGRLAQATRLLRSPRARGGFSGGFGGRYRSGGSWGW